MGKVALDPAFNTERMREYSIVMTAATSTPRRSAAALSRAQFAL
jgi:hypothetical protein